MTLNFIRGLVDGGFTDLHHPEYWDIDFFSQSPQAREYRKIVDSISNSIHFMESISGHHFAELSRAEFFTSHEALHLPFEQARTRRVPRRPTWYNVSTHLPWIGDRTRSPDGAHVEYCRGIANPIGLKIGPSITPEELIELTELLNPENEPGRLILIHRFGADKVAAHLPTLVDAVTAKGKVVLWCCDPMHGNTMMSASGLKTRSFDDILKELEETFAIHDELGTIMGGVHFELTGEHVTECTGGARNLSDHDLQQAYKTQVDPRLNYEQALEMALRIARRMRRDRRRRVVGRPANGIVARRRRGPDLSLDGDIVGDPTPLK
jgi:3-deoxy-7-phosphoheptulonate synthase